MARTKSKKPRNGSPILQNLMQDVAANKSVKGTVINPKGEISISDAISKIIAPYRDTAHNYEAFNKLVTAACTAWNAAILPADQRDKMLADMSAIMPDKQSREDFTEIIAELMKRKNRFYPGVNRMIVEFKVTDQGDDLHLAIASTMGKK